MKIGSISGLAGVVMFTVLVAGCAGGRSDVRDAAETAARSTERATEATRPVPVVEVDEGVDASVVHVVQRGQTAWRIATVYGIQVEKLVAANGITDATDLEVGQRLVVPGADRVLEVPAYPAPLSGPAPEVARIEGSWVWPVPGGNVISYFGAPRKSRKHRGVDIGGNQGDRVLAARAGKVVYSAGDMRGYGKTVIVDHGKGLTTLYAHNSKLLVRPGDRVESGQPIARVGRSGNASTDHCHFELRRDAVAVDPLPYLATGSGGSR